MNQHIVFSRLTDGSNPYANALRDVTIGKPYKFDYEGFEPNCIVFRDDVGDRVVHRLGLGGSIYTFVNPEEVKTKEKDEYENFKEFFYSLEAGDDLNWQEPKYMTKEWDAFIVRHQLAWAVWQKRAEIANGV